MRARQDGRRCHEWRVEAASDRKWSIDSTEEKPDSRLTTAFKQGSGSSCYTQTHTHTHIQIHSVLCSLFSIASVYASVMFTWILLVN